MSESNSTDRSWQSGETHEVLNQSPLFEDIGLYATDRALMEAVEREGAAAHAGDLRRLGEVAGAAHVLGLGRTANECLPVLKRYDEKGKRLDRIAFHPAYHELMALSFREGLHAAGWDHLATGGAPEAGVQVARGARLYMISQAEAGHICPVTMTHASIATLQRDDGLLRAHLPQLLSRTYDPSDKPMATKTSITVGMGMTEKQGGTDVRANMTRAEPLGEPGAYAITGHKWFMSAPMCDAFLILAQAPRGLSCFFLPRFLPDGTRNALRFERLKDKLGNRSNASAEVEFRGAHARLVGEEGRGVPAIIEMVTLTRLDCALASAGLMRFMLANALRHARYRTVFQKKLIDQPLMAQVLADLALDAEAATALAFRLAGSFDRQADAAEAGFRRLMTPAIKYWVCKTQPAFAAEAMECMGGNGYVEEGVMARAYREAPLNAIWEGSGNVMCLDVLRVLAREPDALSAVLSVIEPVAAGDARLSAALGEVKDMLAGGTVPQAGARLFTERLALVAAAALLLANAPPYIAEPFVASRLAGGWRQTYGAGLRGAGHNAILVRAAEGL